MAQIPLGIVSVFNACIYNFDIVVRAQKFSQEFEYLCTRLAIHRARLVLWGETFGIVRAEEGRGAVHYIRSLERPYIKPTVESCLSQLCDLLGKADIILERYSLKDGDPPEVSDSKVFAEQRERINKYLNQKSVAKLTKWALHHEAQFKELIDKIGALLDGLEKILEALGRSEAYQSQFTKETESISDENSLSVSDGVGSSVSASPALKAISDTAGMRHTIIASSSKPYNTAKTTQLDDTPETEGSSSRPQLAQPNAQDGAVDCITKAKPENEALASSDDTLSSLVAEPANRNSLIKAKPKL
ncbi:hypothetical protein DL768_004311 [Monosporascus sp. mg162]|nr:hypothetical protein DL768_004311 [Monosporascus sp. mg162]